MGQMMLKVKILGVEAGSKPIVVINKSDAEEIGVRSLDRVRLKGGSGELTAIVNTTIGNQLKGMIGVYCEVVSSLQLSEGMDVEIEPAMFPSSVQFIRNKLAGKKLSYEELLEIVKDTVEGNLNEIEVAAFVTALHSFGLDLEEAANLSLAMVSTGKRLNLNRVCVDKHSIGGAVGDKTTMLVVPIIAAMGLTIPKTSSRTITSACASADRAEVLMPVNLNLDEMETVVNKTNGCMVWGGSLHMAPADDIFIQVEYPLSIDPLLLPSIMSKKMAVGANYVVIDIPCGRGTKVKTIGDANSLAKDFIGMGEKLNIKVQCAITYGEQPIGWAIGPALEAREALELVMRKKNVPDLAEKATRISDIIMEMVGKGGKGTAMEVLRTGKAEEKLRQIIFEQGGDSEVKPEDIKIGDFGLDIKAEDQGTVLWINNTALIQAARAAGSPKDKGAGMLLHKKLGDPVKKGDILFTIYTEKNNKLERVCKVLQEESPFGIGDKIDMIMKEVKEVEPARKSIILER
jgi:AMP phosphorylase